MLADLQLEIKEAIKAEFGYELPDTQSVISETKKEFDGEYTFVTFPLVKALKSNPVAIGEKIGEKLKAESGLVHDYNVVKGFLNLSMTDAFWTQMSKGLGQTDRFRAKSTGQKFMVEFSSPNTNKPLHLGHIRNILLGWSMAQIAEAYGHEVVKTQVINDRGVAICKSMIAWQDLAEGKTPESTGVKGDHFVGDYYVSFEQTFQKEYGAWQESDQGKAVFNEHSKEGQDSSAFFKSYKNKYFNEYSAIGERTRKMLLDWEAGEEETRSLWNKMNGWVYEGFGATYEKLGVDFDYSNYESETYLLGKEFVEQGLKDAVFYKKDDGSVWADLEDAKMDHKIVLRSDGTSVYVTQDLGTAHMRYKNYEMDHLVYVVADEQDYHFKVLFEILKRLGEPYADNLHHLSYGMVDLPTGKMKSREGTVVDADDLMAEVIGEARKASEARGGLEGLDEAAKSEIYGRVGMAALKYFIIKVNPKKRMTFDPQESLDMQGQTGPYIQNAFVRIKSIFRKAELSYDSMLELLDVKEAWSAQEKALLVQLHGYSDMIEEAYNKYDPSVVANYSYVLAKAFHRFYHDSPILNAASEDMKMRRLALSQLVAQTLDKTMNLLGIEMPEYM